MTTSLGFGYSFNSLASALGGEKSSEDELARAFAVIFSTARQFRVITILQVWFPVLRRFVRLLLFGHCGEPRADAARA